MFSVLYFLQIFFFKKSPFFSFFYKIVFTHFFHVFFEFKYLKLFFALFGVLAQRNTNFFSLKEKNLFYFFILVYTYSFFAVVFLFNSNSIFYSKIFNDAARLYVIDSKQSSRRLLQKFYKNFFFLETVSVYLTNFFFGNYQRWLSSFSISCLNLKFFYFRKEKIFNKGRYSRNRQVYRTGVYWCIYINIIAVVALYYWFYRFIMNFGYLWLLLYFFLLLFFFSCFFYKNFLVYNLLNWFFIFTNLFFYSFKFFISYFLFFIYHNNTSKFNLLVLSKKDS